MKRRYEFDLDGGCLRRLERYFSTHESFALDGSNIPTFRFLNHVEGR